MAAERRLAGLRHGKIQAAGHEIHYLEGGNRQGEPCLLIHGFGADKDNWVRLVHRLGDLRQRFYFLAPDLPGFGESTVLEAAPYEVPAQVERLAAFAEALGLGPAHLVGNSMGGAIAGRFAACHPERTLSLCLLEPIGVRGSEPAELDRLLEEGKNPLLAEDRQSFEELLDFLFEKRPFLPWPVRRFLARRAAFRHGHLTRVWKEIWDDLPEPLDGEAEKITAPTLLLWGDTDRLFHLSALEELHRRIPHATAQVLEGCGHVPMVERPGETARRYREWLDIWSSE